MTFYFSVPGLLPLILTIQVLYAAKDNAVAVAESRAKIVWPWEKQRTIDMKTNKLFVRKNTAEETSFPYAITGRFLVVYTHI